MSDPIVSTPPITPNDDPDRIAWIKAIRKRVEITGWIEPLRMLIQYGKNDLPPDSVGGAHLDEAQQVLTQIELVNNR